MIKVAHGSPPLRSCSAHRTNTTVASASGETCPLANRFGNTNKNTSDAPFIYLDKRLA